MGWRGVRYLHHDEVLVDLGNDRAEIRGHLVLVRCDLTVTGLQWNAESKALGLDLLHALKRRLGAGQRGHVVVAELLAARRNLADESATSELQVRAPVEAAQDMQASRLVDQT
jgi:hypothetical protein